MLIQESFLVLPLAFEFVQHHGQGTVEHLALSLLPRDLLGVEPRRVFVGTLGRLFLHLFSVAVAVHGIVRGRQGKPQFAGPQCILLWWKSTRS